MYPEQDRWLRETEELIWESVTLHLRLKDLADREALSGSRGRRAVAPRTPSVSRKPMCSVTSKRSNGRERSGTSSAPLW